MVVLEPTVDMDLVVIISVNPRTAFTGFSLEGFVVA